MRDRTSLTKSLHTVTVVSRYASLLADTDKGANKGPKAYCKLAIKALGVATEGFDLDSDPTFVACVAAAKRLIAEA